MRRFSPLSFPPRKRGPRNRGGAAATERTAAQWACRRQDAQALLKCQPRPCSGRLGGPMSFWPPSSARWPLGPGVRRENEGVGKRGPRSHDGAAATERTSAQRAFRQHDARVLLKTSTLRAAEAVDRKSTRLNSSHVAISY